MNTSASNRRAKQPPSPPAPAPGSGPGFSPIPTDLGALVRSLDWRTELLALLLVLAETMLVYLAAGFLLAEATTRSDVVPFWVVALLMVTAHVVPRLCDEWRVFTPTYEVVMTGGILLSTLIAIKAASYGNVALWDPFWLQDAGRSAAFLANDAARPIWGIVVLAAWAWWRGRTRAEPGLDSANTMLRVGSLIAAIFLIVILIGAQHEAVIRDRLSLGLIGFYACALGAIGVARLRLEGFRTSGPLGVRWLTTFVLPIIAVVLVALLGASLFSRAVLDTILLLLSPIFWVLSLVFQVIVLIIAVIAYLVITPIIWMIGTPEPGAQEQAPVDPAPDQSQFEQARDSALQAPDALRYLIAALVLFLIVAALTRFVFRRRPRERDTLNEERESVLDWNDLAGSLLDRLRGLRPRRAEDPLAHLRGDPQWRYTVAIREAWMQLQERGEDVGRARRGGETAEDYRVGLLPHAAPAGAGGGRSTAAEPLTTLAQQYRAARYSGQPASAEAAAHTEQALRAVGTLTPLLDAHHGAPGSRTAATTSPPTDGGDQPASTTSATQPAHDRRIASLLGKLGRWRGRSGDDQHR